MNVAALLEAAANILASQAQSAAQAAAQTAAQTAALQNGSGLLGNVGQATADQAAMLANPAVAYQIAQNPYLSSSFMYSAQAAANTTTRTNIDPDVQDLADHYGLDERITKDLDDELKKRPVTWEGDLVALWDILKDARNPPGLLRIKIDEMQANTFIGQPTMDKDIKELQRKYKLDDQATRKLAEVLQRRTETREQDVELMHKHLETSNKPSARVMTMLGKLRSGEPLPEPDKRVAPGSYLDKQERERERKKEEARSRGSRDHRSGRSRDRDRRSRDRDRRRSRSRDRRK